MPKERRGQVICLLLGELKRGDVGNRERREKADRHGRRSWRREKLVSDPRSD